MVGENGRLQREKGRIVNRGWNFGGDKTKRKEIFKEETVGKGWNWRIIGRKEEEEGKKGRRGIVVEGS